MRLENSFLMIPISQKRRIALVSAIGWDSRDDIDDIVMQMRKKGNHLLRLLRYCIVSNEHFTMECPIYCMHYRSILSR